MEKLVELLKCCKWNTAVGPTVSQVRLTALKRALIQKRDPRGMLGWIYHPDTSKVYDLALLVLRLLGDNPDKLPDTIEVSGKASKSGDIEDLLR